MPTQSNPFDFSPEINRYYDMKDKRAAGEAKARQQQFDNTLAQQDSDTRHMQAEAAIVGNVLKEWEKSPSVGKAMWKQLLPDQPLPEIKGNNVKAKFVGPKGEEYEGVGTTEDVNAYCIAVANGVDPIKAGEENNISFNEVRKGGGKKKGSGSGSSKEPTQQQALDKIKAAELSLANLDKTDTITQMMITANPDSDWAKGQKMDEDQKGRVKEALANVIDYNRQFVDPKYLPKKIKEPVIDPNDPNPMGFEEFTNNPSLLSGGLPQ